MAATDDEKLTAECARRGQEVATAVAVDACLVAVAMAGASLLSWWAVAFHPSNSRLWMVPIGLVLACTPAVVYLALSCSSHSRQPSSASVSEKGANAAGDEPPPPLSTVVVEK